MIGKFEVKRRVGNSRLRYEDNIKVDFIARVCGRGVVTGQWEAVGCCKLGNADWASIKCREFVD